MTCPLYLRTWEQCCMIGLRVVGYYIQHRQEPIDRHLLSPSGLGLLQLAWFSFGKTREQLVEYLTKPNSLLRGLTGSWILCFGSRQCKETLLLGLLRDCCLVIEKNISGSRVAISGISRPVGIRETCYQASWHLWSPWIPIGKTLVLRLFEVSQNSFGHSKVILLWLCCLFRENWDRVGQVRPCS